MKLRLWQQEAIGKYEAEQPVDFLVTATPGAGKTTFALTLAKRLVDNRKIDRVIVVAPTDHLRTQWADSAVRSGLMLDPNLPNSVGPVRDGSIGYVTTYAQVAMKPMLHRRRTEVKRTLVIMDEVHHAGDSLSWGDAVYEAFAPARRRLCLTGTPYRTNPNERIPFVKYRQVSADEITTEADYTYGYAEALRDRVVRPVVFAAYSGLARWQNQAGEVLAAELTEESTKSVEDQAWRTVLNPAGQWVPHVIAAIDDRVTHLRENGQPDAAGLILASDQEAARAYADIVKRLTGTKPVVILSDDPKASLKIEKFNKSDDRIAVCVRMISEGVDVPRAAVLGYLTSYRTPLFFAQAVGRVVRARGPHETATVFLPAVRPLLTHAASMEEQRDTVIKIKTAAPSDELDALEAPQDRAREGGESGEYVALDSEAEFAHVLSAGRAAMGDAPVSAPLADITVEDEDFLGIPGLLDAEQTAALLRTRDSAIRERTSALMKEPITTAPNSWREVESLRKEINQMVVRHAKRAGKTPAQAHVELRKAVPGPKTATASIEVLMARRDYMLGVTV